MKRSVYFIALIATAFVMGCNKKEKVNYKDFEEAEQQINEKQKILIESSKEINEDLRQLMNRHPDKNDQLAALMGAGLGLTKEQEAVLLDMVKNEKDPTFKGALQQIVDNKKTLDEKEVNIRKLEEELEGKKLPPYVPYVVRRGETHRSIALNYLMGVCKNQEQAEKMLSKSALYDELAVGVQGLDVLQPQRQCVRHVRYAGHSKYFSL